MKKIIIFGGTTEGRELSNRLANANISHAVSVATDYGQQVMEPNPLVEIYCQRLSYEEMLSFLEEHDFSIVVDATHPYAIVVTDTIKHCVEYWNSLGKNINYLRLERETAMQDSAHLHRYSNHEECLQALKTIPGNLLLTTGSKELASYCKLEEIRQRLYVRVLPGVESLRLCQEQEIQPGQIIAMQGPFTTEMNLALIHQYQIQAIITKQAGKVGGFQEKQKAAEQAGIPLLVIQRQGETESKEVAYSFAMVWDRLQKLLGMDSDITAIPKTSPEIHIILAGIGMGDEGSMTFAVKQAIENADLLIGAERIIAPYPVRLEKKAAYLPEEIKAWSLEKVHQYQGMESLKIVILFSGDSGFYSGCKKVLQEIQEALEQAKINANLSILPGVSSIQTLAAHCRVSWEDAEIYSIHGRNHGDGWEESLLYQIKSSKKLFLLCSGASDVRKLGEMLSEEAYQIFVGYQMSYPEETIGEWTAEQCRTCYQKGLYTVLLQSINSPQSTENMETKACDILTPYHNDSDFIRGKVPMTKEEIREICICKLYLTENSVVYDIGSGTGSIAVEIAGIHPSIRVYAIERKPEAVALIHSNVEALLSRKISIIEGEAPEVLKDLEAPSHVLIGGSHGRLSSILTLLEDRNVPIRVVVNAVSLETISSLIALQRKTNLWNFEIVQVQTSRYQEIGDYHMPKAENPVWICSFDIGGKHA